jgi:hypothetical protein
MLAHMADRLDLSSEQKSEVENLLASGKEENAADHARMQELRTLMIARRAEHRGKWREGGGKQPD